MTPPTGGGTPQAGRGPIAYMARSNVAANLLMVFIVVAGVVSLGGIVQESFPVLAFDQVEVSVPYPGATPEEVEASIVLQIEEEIAGLDGVREVTSVATEGLASVIARLQTGTDVSRAVDDIESAVGRIQTFPAGAERPAVSQTTTRQSVLRLVVYGDVPERALKETAYRIEDELSSLGLASYVDTSGVRNYEISIEVAQQRLRALGLTLEDIAHAVSKGSVELSAGSIETRDAEVRVRTTGRNHDQQDFEEIVVLARGDGALVRLGDIADVRDGFEAVDLITRYNGQRAAFVEVYRSAGEQLLDVTRGVREYVETAVVPSLPAGLAIDVWSDEAELYEGRLDFMLVNGFLGLLLVLTALALFLEFRLAAWVATGIGISFVGALPFMLFLDVSINTTSLFAFILALGIVVDDAIVVAEQIHRERVAGIPGAVTATRATQRIRRPVLCAVLTTITAFAPLLLLPGPLGTMMGQVAIILIAVLVMSLVESLLILPNHLSHLPDPDARPTNLVERFFAAIQTRVSRGMQRFVNGPLDRGVRFATAEPALVLAGGIAVVIVCFALVPAGIIGVIVNDPLEADVVTANLEMPVETPARRTGDTARRLEAAGRRAAARLSAGRGDSAEPLVRGVNLTVGYRPRQFGGDLLAQGPSLKPQGNIAAVEFKLQPIEQRDIAASEFLAVWREEVGPLPEADSLTFSADLVSLGAPVHIELSHPDSGRLRPIADAVVANLRELQGVFDIRADHAASMDELQVALLPEAETLGLTLDDLARQVRSAFFGQEALRVQRGREDVRVYVRLPGDERNAITEVETHVVRTPAGVEVPLSRVAAVSSGTSPLMLNRKDGRRIVTITADVTPELVTGGEVSAALEAGVLADLAVEHPGLTHVFGGPQQQQLESLDALGRGFAIALFIIYALLVIAVGSYTKPLVVMAIIPFGFVGALLGHLIMGLDLSVTSMWGIVGLTGIVVNDSLVMIDFINRRLAEGTPVRDAVIEGAKVRFRPIFITSATTFLGFAPFIFAQSAQGQLLIPLGVSVGFGIAFATVVLVMIVPALAVVQLRAVRTREPALPAVPA